jgi:hypothetical protein
LDRVKHEGGGKENTNAGKAVRKKDWDYAYGYENEKGARAKQQRDFCFVFGIIA